MKLRRSIALVVLTLLVGLGFQGKTVPVTLAIGPNAVRNDAGFNAASLPANDDGSSSAVPLGFTANFFGRSYTTVYVNNNGNITFDSALPTYTPFGLTATRRVIIAPFFADVDTRTGNVVKYGTSMVNGHKAFGANWIGVGYYAQHVDKLNNFQLVLIDRSDVSAGSFDIEFNNDRIQWETGDASGGRGGLGGSSARVGYSNGTGTAGTFLELDGSGVPGAFLDSNFTSGLTHGSRNSNQLGRYLFQVRNGAVDPVDLTVTAIEVTQAVQDLANSVDLVAGKGTYARVHVASLVGGNKANVGARLYRVIGGIQQEPGLLPSNSGGTITVRTAPDRGALNDSYYFALPSAWTNAGSLTLKAVLNPLRSPEETNYDNNTRIATVTFKNVPRMRLREYNVKYKKGATTYQATGTQLYELRSWIRRAYPTSNLDWTELTVDMTDLGRLPTCDEVNSRLSGIRFWQVLFGTVDPRARYYGMVNDGGGFMRGCAIGIPSSVASGPTGSNATSFTWDHDGVSYGDWYGAHELAHTLGRAHANYCGAAGGIAYPYPNGQIGGPAANPKKFYGFDIHLHDIIVYPPTWNDLMTYCNNQWVSDFTYKGLMGKFIAEGVAPLDVSSASLAAVSREYIALRGIIATTVPSATLETAYRVTTTQTFDTPVPGGYFIRLRGGDGALLTQYEFTPLLNSEAAEDVNPMAVLNEVVPFAPGTRTIEITKGDRVLITRAVSLNSPTVHVVTPQGNETIPGDLTVEWTQSHPDNSSLRATVLLSTDGGTTYTPLRTDVIGTRVIIPTTEVPSTSRGRIRVVVSDGVNTAQDDSTGLFTIANHPPRAAILGPDDNSMFVFNQPVSLKGEGANSDGSSLPDSAFQWDSDLNRSLGTGPDLTVDNLVKGTHTIKLTVTGANGLTGVATRRVTVGDTVPAATPRITVAPGTASFVAPFRSTTVQSETLVIRDPAGYTVRWNVTSDASWLTMSDASGTDQSQPFIKVNPSGLASGSYTGKLTFTGTSNGTAVTPQVMAVYLTVDPEPTTPTPTPTPAPSSTPTQMASSTPEPTATSTQAPTATKTSTATIEPNTPEPTATSTQAPTATKTSTSTMEPSSTPTVQPSSTPTSTTAPRPTSTSTGTPLPISINRIYLPMVGRR
ncbi:MAG: hypothetical protein NVS2B7_21200 [Herpetosiphon sp.]